MRVKLPHLSKHAGYLEVRFVSGVVASCLFVWAGFGCESANRPQSPTATESSRSDSESIRKCVEEAVAALNNADVESALELHTDDAVVLKPGSPPGIGKEAMRASLENLFRRLALNESRMIDELEVFGDWAFVRGSYTVTLTPRDSGAPFTENGKYIDLLRRQADGSWKFARGIWNSSDPR